MVERVRLVGRWSVRGVLLYALWLLLVGNVRTPELVAGAVAAVLGVAGVAAARRHLPEYRLELRLLATLLPLPWELLRDSAVVLATLPRRTQGRFRSTSLAVPAGARGRGVQALAEARGSLAPNAYVVDVDAVRRLVLLHELDAGVEGTPL